MLFELFARELRKHFVHLALSQGLLARCRTHTDGDTDTGTGIDKETW
jgi:hypothetical protein